MSDSERYTFIAVISIVLPGHNRETEIEVVLTPADDVILADGTAKLLQDCTLAELGHFAGEMEMELWTNYQDTPLIDLAAGDETGISIRVLDEGQDDQPEFALWTENLAIIGGRKLGKDSSEESVPLFSQEIIKEHPVEPDVAEEKSDKGELDEDDFDVISAEEKVVAAVQEEPALDTLAEAMDTLEEALEEFDVAVAEPELVFEERVVSDEIETPAEPFEPTEIRILGRRRPVNHPTWTAVDILVNENAFRNAQEHASSSLNREVAGILVGPMPEKQPDGRYLVHIIDTIIAKHTKMHGASVTYTPESWRYISDKLIELYPEDSAVIVGWYHTHPGFGIFLSSMDRFIHQNFFIQKWHIALVLDPVATKSGFFCWDRKQELVDSYEFPWPQWAANSW